MTNNEMNEISSRVGQIIAEDNSRIMQSFLSNLNNLYKIIDTLKADICKWHDEDKARMTNISDRVDSLEKRVEDMEKKMRQWKS